MNRFNQITTASVLILLIIFGLYGKNRLESGIREIVARDLKTTINSNAEGLKQWLKDKQRMAGTIASLPDISRQSYLLNNSVLSSESRASATRTLVAQIDRLSNRNMNGFDNFFILDKAGAILASKKPIHIDANKNNWPAALVNDVSATCNCRVKPTYLLSESGEKKLLIFFVLPLRIKSVQGGNFLVFSIEPEQNFSRILLSTRSGKSGESYVINDDGMMICGSHFKGLANKNATSSMKNHMRSSHKHTLSEVAQRAFSDDEFRYPGVGTNLAGYRNYAGVETVGAWTYIKEYNFAIISEISYDEAFAPLKSFRQLFWYFSCMALLLALALITSSIITWRMKEKVRLALDEINELGEYRLLHKIGEGAHGIVYKAEHKLMQRQTAIKLLKPDVCTDTNINRFLQEVKLTCRLSHPNTIRIYDYGKTTDGHFYYVMEYLKGIDLEKLMRAVGPLPANRAIYLLKQVCASLKEAHAEGLIHRDIKPHNIFLCEQGGERDVVKVLDFGLVSHINQPDEDDKFISGTPHYISPEAIQRPTQLDQRSDIYAVGVMAFYMLTGRYPFNRNEESIHEIFKQQVNQEAPKPSSVVKFHIPEDLEKIIMSCLEKLPDKRPQSAVQLNLLFDQCNMAREWDSATAREWWDFTALAHEDQIQQFNQYDNTVKLCMDI